MSALFIVIAVAAMLVAILTSRKRRADPDFETLRAHHPRGFWTGIGAALGLALGALLGLVLEYVVGAGGGGAAIGAALGIAVGAAAGATVERRHKGEARSLTSYEKRARRWMIGVGVVVAVPLVAAAALCGAALLLR